MQVSYYAARANLYYLSQRRPEWTHAQLATALGASLSWVQRWLARLRDGQAAGLPLEQTSGQAIPVLVKLLLPRRPPLW